MQLGVGVGLKPSYCFWLNKRLCCGRVPGFAPSLWLYHPSISLHLHTHSIHIYVLLFFASHDIRADMFRKGQRVRYVVMKITVALCSAFGIIAARICVYAQRLLFVTGR